MGRRARARRPTSAGRGTADKGKGGTAARAAVATDGLVCGRRKGAASTYLITLTGSEREGGSHNYS